MTTDQTTVTGLRRLASAGHGGTLLSKPVGTSLVSDGLAELLERATMKRAGLYRITPLGISALDTLND